jgi:CRISPR-associated protein Csb3
LKYSVPNIKVHVDVTNPGQFFGCCGLLELADRFCDGAEGWFEADNFHIASEPQLSLASLQESIRALEVTNCMTAEQNVRLKQLASMTKQQRISQKLEEEKKQLDSLRRESPIRLKGKIDLVIDWFRDDCAGGSRFKTWAGQQSVLDISVSMHSALSEANDSIWHAVFGAGLPFNFDSDLGVQGSAIDLGFSFDPLSGSAATRIEISCRPGLELLCFIGLQRFRPKEMADRNRFTYFAWTTPCRPNIAAALAACSIESKNGTRFVFPLLYRTKYLKSFLPATPVGVRT